MDGVTLVYTDADGSAIRALDGVSLALERGEWLCVLGANGSGKSTLAQVIAGLLAPDEGAVSLFGREVCRDGKPDFAAYHDARSKLGIVFQNPTDQIVTSIVEEDVAFGPENLGLPPAEIATRVKRELERVAMDSYAKADPAHLSGGQRQRVTIASALAMEPEVLVLDEPTSQLDVRGRHALARAIGRLRNDGVSIVHVTHDMEDALLADRILVLDHGRIALEGTPEEVFAHADELMALNLEQPFPARLVEALACLGVRFPWTLDAQSLSERITACIPAGTGAARPDESGVDAASEHTSTDAPLVLERVSFSYGSNGAGPDFGVADIGFSVQPGEMLAIIGQTGSGKSTIARLACALEMPDAGTVRVLGTDTSDKRRLPSIRGRIGYVMQHPERQLFATTVAEDVAYGPRNMGLPAAEVERRVAQTLDLVGLSNRRESSPFSLSGGQRRLCAIAGVLAMGPSILVLDEPMAGLDPKGRAELSALLDALRAEGTALVEITHSMEEAAKADRIAFADGGRLVALEPPRALFQREEQLSSCGLGIPEALGFAHGISPALGEPLTLDALCDAICSAMDVTDGDAGSGTAEEVDHGA
ncbi:MAG: ATP-binding cassette domain-containing protein [Atopobiaceae bacterium]|nr:ATP-binding cassette domain-containing protein [Atopobiaceae bacterium]